MVQDPVTRKPQASPEGAGHSGPAIEAFIDLLARLIAREHARRSGQIQLPPPGSPKADRDRPRKAAPQRKTP